MRKIAALGCVAGIVGVMTEALVPAAQTRAPAAGGGTPRIQVCTLLPKEEVKKHLPWIAALDQLPLQEEPVGESGSSCSFPTVHVQVLPFTQGFIDAARKAAPLEAVAGVGDAAYFRNNKDRFAELLVKIGPRLLTLQADVNDNMPTVKSRTIDLAKVYVAQLR